MVSNESADILRLFNTAFADLVPGRPDLYPADLAADIDALNAEVYLRSKALDCHSRTWSSTPSVARLIRPGDTCRS
tara:strand:+ start:876 stop:1103 length:228 start_codon:yes stop_codon:yes gene_type:complete